MDNKMKDKEAFQNFINRHDFNRDIEAYSLWQAACQYKQKEIDELKSTLIYVYNWYGRFMGDVAKDKIKKAVEGENE